MLKVLTLTSLFTFWLNWLAGYLHPPAEWWEEEVERRLGRCLNWLFSLLRYSSYPTVLLMAVILLCLCCLVTLWCWGFDLGRENTLHYCICWDTFIIILFNFSLGTVKGEVCLLQLTPNCIYPKKSQTQTPLLQLSNHQTGDQLDTWAVPITYWLLQCSYGCGH